MDFQFYAEKLLSNEHYLIFKKENNGAICASAFFVIDKEGKESKQHFDFWLPVEKKLFSFKLEAGGEMIPVEVLEEGYDPLSIPLNLTFNFSDVEEVIHSRMNKENIDKKVQKMLLSLQLKEGKPYLVGTVFISMMGMLKIVYSLEEKKLEEFEKKSFFDIMKVGNGKKEN